MKIKKYAPSKNIVDRSRINTASQTDRMTQTVNSRAKHPSQRPSAQKKDYGDTQAPWMDDTWRIDTGQKENTLPSYQGPIVNDGNKANYAEVVAQEIKDKFSKPAYGKGWSKY